MYIEPQPALIKRHNLALDSIDFCRFSFQLPQKPNHKALLLILEVCFSCILFVLHSRRQSCDRWPLMEHSLRNVHFQHCSGYATVSPLTLCVSHVRMQVCRALNYVQALAVHWCHEAGYHRKSERGGSWPFAFMNTMSRAGGVPSVALISGDTNTADAVVKKNKRFSSGCSQDPSH